jgi:hypothetical protein
MKTLWIISLLNLSINLSAQFLNGIVTDKNNNPIPFVSIGATNHNYGTIASDNGNFSLDLKRINPYDTVRFSSVGYKSKDFLLSKIKDNKYIYVTLEEEVYQIGEVQIKPLAKKLIEFGQRKVHKDGGFGFGGVGEGCEVANLYVNSRSTWLKDLQFHLTFSNYDSILFRINVYSVLDSLPYKTINQSPIFVKTKIKSGWIKKDLSDLDLIIDDDFVISIEPVQAWGQISQNLNNKLQIVLSGKYKNNNGVTLSRIFSLGYWRKGNMFMDYYLTGY